MRLKVLGLVIGAVAVLVTGLCTGAALALAVTRGGASHGDHIAVIPIEGEIVSTSATGLFGSGGAGADTIIEQLERARGDSSVRAVILRVDSPGGSATASHRIYLEVQRVRAAGIPVVAWFGDIAASGGYYVSAPADRIVAMPGTITGSIGVIASVPNMQELYDKLGIDMQIVKSGTFKDMLSPSRPMTEEEREILDALIQESYDEFVRVVADGRGLPEDQVREIADGRIYSGQQALDLGLVDELGDMTVAEQLAAELAGLGDNPEVVVYGPEPSFLDYLFGQAAGRLGLGLPAGLDFPSTHITVRY